ncbi:MAG: hypothetical protein LBV71_01245 [Prevotella sp.]|jgi:uncharacterized protein (DUF608 family)|nr:hypothetical protein [Prevotella sp.]
MKQYSTLVLLFLLPLFVFSQQISSDHKVSPDKGNIQAFIGDKNSKGERKVYKGNELVTIGMPCGGIAAGQLYVRGDGTLANWWIANNAYNTGYGIDWLLNFETPLGPWKVCYQTFEPMSYIDQGFKITVDDSQKKYTKELSKKDFDDISFIGEYPIAFIDYNSKSNELPVKVSSQVYSPFIPLNAKESATPATILKYTVKNTSDKTVKADLTGWMQNLVCIDLKDRAGGTLRNKVVSNASQKSVYMDMSVSGKVKDDKSPTRKFKVFDDFESGNYNNWRVEGTAFGNKPAAGELCNQNPLGGDYGKGLANSYSDYDKPTGKMTSKTFTISDKYITFNIAGGAHKGKTCMNLVIDGIVAMSATGNNNEDFLPRNWDVSKWKGKKAYFEIIDDVTGDWGHISVDNIQFANEPVGMPRIKIDETHAYFGNLSLTVFDANATATADITKDGLAYAEALLGDKLNGGLTSTMSLKPGESKEVIFVLSWYFPNRPLSYKGSEWNRPLPPNSPAIGNMYSNWYNSSLDVAEQLHENYSKLEKATFDFHDTYYNQTTLPYWLTHRLMMPISILASETCQWWATDKFWAWEGVGSCEGTCTHVWGYAQAMAALFPELERNLREKTDYSVSLQPDGGILSRNGEHGILIDGHASVILRMYREHLMSKDNFFLSRNWAKIKKSLEYIIREDGNEDGLIVKKQPNTYDISFHGANTYVGALYLAALRAGEKMAMIMNDTTAAERYKKIYTAGSDNTMDRLWNGEYFIQDVDEKEYPEHQYGKGCLSDQLFGQTWADLLRLGDLYPNDAIDKALRSVWKYNWTNDVGPQTEAHLPERYYAHSGEPGLLICTWPHSKHPGEAGVRYRDEVWTGIEYQVATNMILRGMVDEGLAIVKAVHSRYDGAKHNPWNEIECGDHYARAMASYGVLNAIQNYWYDGPKGVMSFSPKLISNKFRGFFTAAEGWGNISQTGEGRNQQNTIEVKHGRLALQKVKLSVPAGFTPQKVEVFCNDKVIPATFDVNDQIDISFDKLNLKTGDKIKVVFL